METYININEAGELIGNYCSGKAYFAQTDERKAALLELATLGINSLGDAAFGLGYKGNKLRSDQKNEFPRDLFDPVPFEVKLACAAEAAMLAGGEDEERLRLRRNGVSGVSINGASESFKPVSRIEGLVSRSAFSLLVPFLNRGESAEIR